MSFGFSVGDFINVGSLAYNLYRRCKDSVTEFKDLSRDVRSMHIVFSTIQEYWEQQQREGHNLSDKHLASLQELSVDCKEVLGELETLLDKHGELGAGAGFLSRMKWTVHNIAPLRLRLLARTNYLSSFNNMMMASSAASQRMKSQARVLAALNVINYGYHSGKRTAPAFSQATDPTFLDNKETWKEIIEDLKDEGVDKESVDSQETFIKSWIDEVILSDEGYCSDQGSQGESERGSFSVAPSFSMGGEPYSMSVSHPPSSPQRPPWELFRAQTVPSVATQPQVEVPYRRPRPSQSSISSQDYRARLEQPHISHTSHIKEVLMPLFRLEYGASRDEPFLQSTIEHLFNRLDVLKRGLYRAQFESQCVQAVESIEPTARGNIIDIIHAAARTTGGHFDQTTFTELFFAILEQLQAFKDQELEARFQEDQAIVEESDRWGESIAYSWICSELKDRLLLEILPLGYAVETESAVPAFTSTAEDVLCHSIASPTIPSAIMATFAGMALLADFCNAQILHISEVWTDHNPIDLDYLKQYLNILYNVLDAAHKYDVLAGDLNEKHSNHLDKIIEAADMIDFTDPSNLEYVSCPIRELRKLQHDAYRTLQKMFGFLFDLTSESVQKDVKDNSRIEFIPGRHGSVVLKYLETPPRPAHWRMKLEMQSEAILQSTQWHAASEAIISHCQNWYLEHKSLLRRADDALKCSQKLQRQAKKCRHLIPRYIEEPITEKFVYLKIENLKALPRGNKVFRAQAPKIYAKIFVDNQCLHNQFATREDHGSDKVYLWGGDPYHITVHAKSVIQIRIHNAHRSDRDDAGYQGVVYIPLDSLGGPTVQAKPQTKELTNNFSKGKECKGMLTFTIHWCNTTHFIRQQSGLYSGHWARKDTADGRFLFEDLEAGEVGQSSRTAIIERRKDSLKPTPTRLRILKPT